MSDRFWVGSTASWDGTAGTKWATTSGGAGGAAIPTSADDVYLDAASGAVTVTVATGNTGCLSLICTGFTGTLAGSADLSLSGRWTLASGMTMSHTGTINFSATGGPHNLTFAGVTINSILAFNGGGGNWVFQDALTTANTTLNHTAGTLDLNGMAVNLGTGLFTSGGSAVRVLTLGASTITCGSWTSNGSNITLNAGTSVITCTGNMVILTAQTFYGVVMTSNGVASITGGNLTCTNFTRSNTSGYAELNTSNMTVSGVLTLTGADAGANRLLVAVNGLNNTGTITTNGTFSLTNVDFRSITKAGTSATWSGTSMGNCGDCTNITFTTAVNRYWVGNGGAITDTTHWSASTGGASGASMPLPQDTMFFDANSFSGASQTVTVGTANFRMPTVNWTGATNAPAFNLDVTTEFYGSITFISAMTLTQGSNTVGFIWLESSRTVTSAGQSWGAGTINMISRAGTLTLQDAFSTSGAFNQKAGTLDANNFSFTASTFDNSPLAAVARVTTMGSGTWTITGSGATTWYYNPTAATLNEGTSTLKFTNNSAVDKTFTGNETYYNFWNATQGTGVVIMNSSSTWNDFKIDAGRTQQFATTTTTTVTTLTAIGAGTIITSSTAATHTLSAAAGTIAVQNCTISYSVAQGGATWNAFTSLGNVDGGNNTGWNFSSSLSTLKTWNGVVKANIKTMDGIALANVKTWCGVA